MAISLGSLIVSLKAETASFIQGMTQAGQSAQKTAKEIEHSFAGAGDIAAKFLAPFGEIGAKLGEVFNVAGEAMAGAVGNIGAVGEVLGPIGALAGVAAVSVAALGVAGLGIAAWAAHGADELQKLSEKTGVAVEQLSLLTTLGKEEGVGPEQMAASLEKLAKSAFAAATAAPGTLNAYNRLGIAVKDAGGKMRSASDIFADVADKFEHLEGGPVKTALAMQLFGKSGAELIPVLNKGSEHVRQLKADMEQFGAVVDSETAKNSEKFEQSFDRIGVVLSGASNQLLKELLPTMNATMSFIIDALKDQDGSWATFGTAVKYAVGGIIDIIKGAVVVIATIGTAFDYAAAAGKASIGALGSLFGGLSEAISKATHGDFKGAANALSDSFKLGMGDFVSTVTTETDKADARLQKLIGGVVFGQSPTSKTEGPKDDGKNLLGVEGADAAYKKLTETLAELARVKAKTDEILRKSFFEGQKKDAEEAQKGLESFGKATLDFARSMQAARQIALENSQQSHDNDFAAEVQSIQAAAQLGVITETQKAEKLRALYKREEDDRIAYLQTIRDAEQGLADHLRELVNADPGNVGLKTRLQDALNQIALTDQQIKNTQADFTRDINTQTTAIQSQLTTTGAGFRRWVLDVKNQSQNLGTQLRDALSQSLDGLNDQFAQLAITGKASFGDLAKSFGEALLKMELQSAESKLFSWLTKLGGASSTASGASGSGGGFLGALGSLFGGFKENGGSVQPGKAYVVGERRPELFIPTTHGRIAPNTAMSASSGPVVHYAPVYNINTPNADSFRKSQQQIVTEGYRHATSAASRNR